MWNEPIVADLLGSFWLEASSSANSLFATRLSSFGERITDQDSGEVHIWMWFRPMVFNPSWRILSHAWRKVPCTWGRWQVGEQSLAGDIGWSSAKRFTNHSYIPVVYPVIWKILALDALACSSFSGRQWPTFATPVWYHSSIFMGGLLFLYL